MLLFPEEESFQLDLPDADILYYPKCFDHEAANSYFEALLHKIPWQQDTITIFGKQYQQPRLTALFANNNTPYSYSNITMYPLAFNAVLETIKTKVETKTQQHFTSCLCNLYRDGSDSNGWHADNEKELGKNPVIASVSFGAERLFKLKHRHDPSLKHRLTLQHGSLLLMKGSTQHYWLHQIPKTKKPIGKRINLTFRIIK